MCPEFERVERIVQKDVWAEETVSTLTCRYLLGISLRLLTISFEALIIICRQFFFIFTNNLLAIQELKTLPDGSTSRVPAERLMVKKFRRAAAGLDEQLPSELRPPDVLKVSLFDTSPIELQMLTCGIL